MSAALEVAVRRLLVAAHVRLENRALRLHGSVVEDVAHVQRVRVPGHHVRPARITGRERPHDVAKRADDVRLDLAQPGVARDPLLVALGQPAPHLGDVRVEEAGELDRVLGGAAHEARRPRHAVLQHPRAKAARLRRRPRTAVERRGQAALGVREWDVDLVVRTSRLGHAPERLLELVVAQLEHQRPDDGDRNHRRAREHLVCGRERREVDRRHVAVQSQCLLPRPDRLRIVLAGPPRHDAELSRG